MRNHEVVKNHNLLDENGHLIEPGWSKSLIQKYDRNLLRFRSAKRICRRLRQKVMLRLKIKISIFLLLIRVHQDL